MSAWKPANQPVCRAAVNGGFSGALYQLWLMYFSRVQFID
jgi:hypothetical protein